MRQAVVFEEHAAVLAHWAGRGLRDATVVMLDAHLDFQPVGAAAIEHLRRCTDPLKLRACGCELPFSDGGRGLYGIEDFLHPAVALGLVGTVVWVLPPHVERAGLAGGLARLVQMEAVTIEALETFESQPGGWLRGHLLGLDLWVCLPAHLDRLPLPPAWELDIDLDFFVDLPSGALVLDPAALLRSLRGRAGSPQVLTISRSVRSGFTPPALGRLAEPLAAIWCGDNGGGPDPFPTQGLDDAGDKVDLRSSIAAAHSRALAVSPGNMMDWCRRLDEEPWTDDGATAAAWVHLGLMACAAGLPELASHAWARSTADGRPHPELALELAMTLARRGLGEQAVEPLAFARRFASTRWRATLLACRLALQRGDLGQALSEAHAVVQACTASPEGLELLAQACRGLANEAGAGDARAAAMDLRRRLARVAARLVVVPPG